MPSSSARYDVIIVGGGACGSLAAHQLTARGLDVLLVEAGPRILVNPASSEPSVTQPVQSQCLAYTAGARHLFVDDSLNPYATPRDRPFLWIRGRQLGGKTHLWGYGTPRWSRDEFNGLARVDEEGEWPFEYDDLVPHYEAVEELYGVVGAPEALGEQPSEKWRPARPMTPAESDFKSAVEKEWPGRLVSLLPYAAPFAPGEVEDFDRLNAYLLDPSNGPMWGCSVRSILPVAEATGRLTIVDDSIVQSVLVDDRSALARGVRTLDRTTGEASNRFARSVMICASTLESTRILLNSRSARRPDGLANSSGTLGRYLADHLWGIGLSAVSEQPVAGRGLDAYPPLLIPPFRVDGKTSFERFQLVCYLQKGSDGRTYLRIDAHLEASSCRDNRVSIEDGLVDGWQVPALRIDYRNTEHDYALIETALAAAEEIATAAGFRVLSRDEEPMTPGISVHEAGTARMGARPESSVLNSFCQTWDVPNLFVADGSAFPRAGVRNPMITLLALTHRACGRLERYLNGKARSVCYDSPGTEVEGRRLNQCRLTLPGSKVEGR